MTTAASRQLRRIGITVAGLLISVVSLVLVARSVNVGDAARILVGASIAPLLLALAAVLLALGFRFLTCYTLLPDLPDGSRIPVRRVVTPVVIGYLGNIVLPARLGEVVRAYMIARREHIAFAGTLGSVALERVIDTATLAVMAFIAGSLVGAAPWIVQGTAIVAAIGLVLVAMLATVGLEPLVVLIGRMGAVHTVLSGPAARAQRLIAPFAHWSGGAHRRRAIGLALLLSLAAWLCNAAMFWLVAQAVGATLAPSDAILVMAVTALSTAIPSAPGYVGTFELAAVAVLSSLGIPRDAALAIAVLAHILGLLPTAVGGSVAIMRLGGGLRRLSSEAEAQLPAAEA